MAETTQAVPKRDGAAELPTPPSDEDVGVPVDAQLFDVPLVPAVKLAAEAVALSFVMAPNISSSACAVVAVAPLEGEELEAPPEVVLSSGELASPVTENAWRRRVSTPAPGPPAFQVTMIEEPEGSAEEIACVEQMVVSAEVGVLDTSVA